MSFDKEKIKEQLIKNSSVDYREETAIARFFSPFYEIDWYVIKYEPTSDICYGYIVDGKYNEDIYSFFSVDELDQANKDFEFILFDESFENKKIEKIKEEANEKSNSNS